MTTILTILLLAALVGLVKPYINGSKRWQFGLTAFVSLILIGALAAPTTEVSEKTIASADASSAPPSPNNDAVLTKKSVPKELAGEWTYSTEQDEMRGAETHFAQLDASNTLTLDFPYGEQRGRILIRQSPKFGFDVMAGVSSGQIMCSSYSNAHINVKFDDGPIQRYGCADASDGSSSMIFVEGAKGFLANLKKSKKVVIEAEFFQNGMQQMTFNSANLKWDS